VKLSVLDQSPVSAGMTSAEALQNTIELARLSDELGYQRYWIAEHHAMAALASPAPEILIARIGAETSRIRVGSGGVMLPHYSPLKVAEVFRMLHALYPGRIDLGIGRAPGGTPLETFALQRNRTRQMPDDFTDQVTELLQFLHGKFPADHPFERIVVAPEMPGAPEVWMLGSSMWSSAAAAQFGLPYAFAHFIDPNPTRSAIEQYRFQFRRSEYLDEPLAIVAIGALIADTDEEAARLLTSARLFRRRIRQGLVGPIPTPEEAIAELGPDRPRDQSETSEWPRYFFGSPERVHADITRMTEELQIDEVMVVTIVHSHAARLRSYELLAEAFGLTGPQPAQVSGNELGVR
jgi:luciferase family oxidoreductase group 1